ncbi:MAG: hypothetical protein U5S82_18850 [Gammaproteobacteria bacterium]|nr:hypothetical protein [Gammaproteobacteria bacterium]
MVRVRHQDPAEFEGGHSRSPRRAPRTRERGGSKSMHEGVAVWCDCCSCEMEPYWAEAAAEMGVELVSDYEDGED